MAVRFVPDVTRRAVQPNPPATVAAIMRAQGATTGEARRFANLPSAPTMARLQQAGGATVGEAQRFANIAAQASARRNLAGPIAAPVQTAPTLSSAPVTQTPVTQTPVADEQVITDVSTDTPVEAAAPTATPYSVYDDPTYQQALAQAQSAFNLDRAAALANMQYEQRPIQRALEERIPAAEAERRRLAGNFARRGMAGGRYGALTRAEAEVNAREIGLRTGLREQMAELTRQFTANFGAEGTDWLGTRRGFEAQQAAIQAALQNRLAGLTTVG